MSMRNEIDLLKAKIDKFSNEDIANSIANAQTQLSQAKIKQKVFKIFYCFWIKIHLLKY